MNSAENLRRLANPGVHLPSWAPLATLFWEGPQLETLLSICLGVGLSAACGFRVFVPPLLAGLAAATGHVSLPESAMWLASPLALTLLGTAALLEIGAYFLPFIDNALDTVAAPTAVIAGTLLTASLIVDASPAVRWSLALIAGGGAAATTQTLTSLTRAGSTVATAGLANPAFAGIETAASIGATTLALLAPVAATVVLILTIALTVRLLRRSRVRNATTG